MPARIVPVGASHAALIAALQAACFDQPWGASGVGAILGNPGGTAVVALDGPAEAPRPLGFALMRRAADEAELLAIGVLPAARGQGLGQALLDAVLADAAAGGTRVLFLEVAIDNRPACALYRRAGFAEVGRRPGYYWPRGGPPVDALILRRTLDPPAAAPAPPG